MVIVQHYPRTVKEYITATEDSLVGVLIIPGRCPDPDCQASDSLIRWGSYQRGALFQDEIHLIRVQRLRCKACGRTHSLLPDFLHPHRHYVIALLQTVVSLYLIEGWGLARVQAHLSAQCAVPSRATGPARSTVREWIRSYAFGAGKLLLDRLLRYWLALDPSAQIPEDPPPDHLRRIPGEKQRRRLQRAHRFWRLAELLYALTKNRLPALHFAADQLLPFVLQWLQTQLLSPRLFWSPLLPHTPTTPF